MIRDEWKFGVTFFADREARTKRQAEMNSVELIALIETTSAPTKTALPWLKLATFGDERTETGSLRHDHNVGVLTGVVGDYDGENVSLDAAVDLLYEAGVEAILYSSPSSTPSRPRWRVVCPFLEPLYIPERGHPVMLGRVNGVLGGILAPESWTLSQCYYFGKALDNADADFRVILVPGGGPIDQLCELNERSVGKPGYSGTGTGGRGGGRRRSAAYWRAIKAGVPEHGIPELGIAGRDAALASLAGALLADGTVKDKDHLRTWLKLCNERYCRPPLKMPDVQKVWKSIARRHGL